MNLQLGESNIELSLLNSESLHKEDSHYSQLSVPDEVCSISASSNLNNSTLSFHRQRRQPTQQGLLWQPFKLCEDYFGTKTIIIYIFVGPLLLVLSALIYQIITTKMLIGTGQVIFFRSCFILALMVTVSIYNTSKETSTPEVKISQNEDGSPHFSTEHRLVVISCAIINAICNLAFLRSIELLPISSGFCSILLLRPLSLVYEKRLTIFQYFSQEKIMLVLSLLGYLAILLPFKSAQLVGGCLGLVVTFSNFFYEKMFYGLHALFSVLEMTIISTSVLGVFSAIIMIFEGPRLPSIFETFLLIISSIFYTLSLLVVQRLSDLIDDEALRVIYINQIIMGFLLDYLMDIHTTSLWDLLGSFLIIFAVNQGRFGTIMGKIIYLATFKDNSRGINWSENGSTRSPKIMPGPALSVFTLGSRMPGGIRPVTQSVT